MSPVSPAARILGAGGWIGLVLFLVWQEFFVETPGPWPTPWWFRVPVTLALGLVVLIFALECLMQEMTVRRWATSLLVFSVFGLAFLAAGIFKPELLNLSRWVIIPLGAFYLAAAASIAVGARDSL